MADKRSIGVTIFGWIFIVFVVLLLIGLPFRIANYNKLVSLFQIELDYPSIMRLLQGSSIFSIIGILFSSFFLLITGTGLLKLRPWARYLVLVLMLGLLVNVYWANWFFGPQMYIPLQVAMWIFIPIFVFLFFLRPSIKEQFGRDIGIKRLRLVAKILIGLLLASVVLRALSVPLWIAYAKVKYKELLPMVNQRPQKVEYLVKDRQFLLGECEKKNIFGYSIYLPKGLELSHISKGEPPFGWNVGLIKRKNSDVRVWAILDSKSSGEGMLSGISKVLKFDSGYDFEKRLNYPTWSPIYLIMKVLGTPRNLEALEEATSSSWRGFIKAAYPKEKKRWIFECSLYDIEGRGRGSGGVVLMFKDEEMTLEQARDIIASLRFEEVKKDSIEFFNLGKKELSKKNFTDASINFIDALYMNDQNPEYSYYLAWSLFEDDSQAGMKVRLGSSKKFLECALELNPDYQEAKDLLISVNNKIQQIEKEKGPE